MYVCKQTWQEVVMTDVIASYRGTVNNENMLHYKESVWVNKSVE